MTRSAEPRRDSTRCSADAFRQCVRSNRRMTTPVADHVAVTLGAWTSPAKKVCFASICSSLAVFITRSMTLGVVDDDAGHDRQLLIAWASEPKPKKESIMSVKGGLASEPWTVEGALHLALAAVAMLGWAV